MKKRLKTGGRTKGTPNRLTKELRSVLKNVLANEIKRIPDTLEQLEAKDRLEMVIKLLPYTLPKIDSVHMAEDEPMQKDGW